MLTSNFRHLRVFSCIMIFKPRNTALKRTRRFILKLLGFARRIGTEKGLLEYVIVLEIMLFLDLVEQLKEVRLPDGTTEFVGEVFLDWVRRKTPS